MDVTELNRQNISLQTRHPWETVRSRIVAFLLCKYAPRHPNHILEIGGGDAFISREMAKANPNATYSSIDTAYTPELISSLKNAPLGKLVDFYPSTLSFESAADPAALVLLPDVLEHVNDDKSLLQIAMKNTVSAPDATLLITVPAFQLLFSTHDRLLQHHRRYTLRQVSNLCRSQQLTIVKSGYFFFSLLIIRCFQKLLEKTGIKKRERSIDNWKQGKSLTILISLILWADFKVCFMLSRIGIIIPGLSCYCICKKSPS